MVKLKIIDAAKKLILEKQASNLTFEDIASHAEIPVNRVKKIYDSVEDVALALAEKSLSDHEKRSQKIVQLSNSLEVFSTLLRHDMKLIYSLEQEWVTLSPLCKYKESFNLFHDYFENTMPSYYFEIFKQHSSILPQKGMDIRLYAHFVVHSIFFFRKEQLKDLSNEFIDPESTTRQLIASLFSPKTDTLLTSH
jgi:AcrR family transcriptional regulator